MPHRLPCQQANWVLLAPAVASGLFGSLALKSGPMILANRESQLLATRSPRLYYDLTLTQLGDLWQKSCPSLSLQPSVQVCWSLRAQMFKNSLISRNMMGHKGFFGHGSSMSSMSALALEAFWPKLGSMSRHRCSKGHHCWAGGHQRTLKPRPALDFCGSQ